MNWNHNFLGERCNEIYNSNIYLLVFNASWQWWVIMCAWMMVEIVLIIGKFSQEYKKQKDQINGIFAKENLQAIWNDGFKAGTQHTQVQKH